jgi:geranylgeranyl diphosphate synthase type II
VVVTVSVDDELARFARTGLDRSASYGEDCHELWVALQQATSSGKRLRSRLLLAAHRAYGGSDAEVAARVAAAIELLHAGFVIHDDVIDRDLKRRGMLNVSGVFAERARARGVSDDGCETLALTAGLLAGDLVLIGATREIALCGADAATTVRLLDLLGEAVEVSAAGELSDVAMSVGASADLSLGDVITVEERKTAAYSFQLPLQAGAVLAGGPEEAVELLGTVGRLAGVGFQLVDDLRGVFSDESVTGKSSLGDLREGKVTALIAHARSTDAWTEISQYVGDPTLDAERADVARRLLEACGSRAFVEELADNYLTAAVRAAEGAGVEPSLRAELSTLCRRIMRSAA